MIDTNGYLALAHLDDATAFERLRAFVVGEYPSYTVAQSEVAGTANWAAPRGLAFTWIASGQLDVMVHSNGRRPVGAREADRVAPTRLGTGDVLVLDGEHAARVHGAAQLLHIASEGVARSPFAGTRRLAELPDQAGGCNVGENAFRRLQITWQADGQTAERPDGDNVVGCHVVWIAQATSRTHYHPVPAQHGGLNQHELYLVLDPPHHGLHGTAASAGVWTYPEPGNWSRYDWTPLRPGDVCAIKAGVAHRAVDVLACVIAIPGFKPGNDVYVDELIARADASAPYNPQFA